ncbi:MAG: ribonuclease III [Peptoniphilaceae bacterium]|nr:ribonuclease III [Peptoniphilaceae bacterium]MDY6085569.1 ribonuclease III [Peptoniphilaceae bacterium]
MNEARRDALRQFAASWGAPVENFDLLDRAFVHRSMLNESPETFHESNERLEFLGDAVMQILATEYLFKHFPRDPEGELSRKRALAVCEDSFAKLGREIGIPPLLYLGHGAEMQGGREKPSLIADAFEAVSGAVYLDGGLPFLRDWFFEKLRSMEDLFAANRAGTDAKTTLQTVLFRAGQSYRYVLIRTEGPPNDRRFTMALEVEGRKVSKGSGSSKKRAEEEAARIYLEERDAAQNR